MAMALALWQEFVIRSYADQLFDKLTLSATSHWFSNLTDTDFSRYLCSGTNYDVKYFEKFQLNQ